eukprot:347922-Chlamydomonas_euryale.AAC.2
MQGEYYMGRKAMSVFFFGGVWAWREVRLAQDAVRTSCLMNGQDWVAEDAVPAAGADPGPRAEGSSSSCTCSLYIPDDVH